METVTCDIAAFTAHPDDMELNCGGTLALSVAQGWKAAAVDFTRGELGTRGTPEIRAREAEAAARILGLTCRMNLGLPDGHLHDSDEARKIVVRVLRTLRPRVVIAPPLVDHHPDHVAVAVILARSMHLAGVARYLPDIEPWKPHVLLHYAGGRAIAPSIIVDTTSVHETRRRAILEYRSQFHQEGSTERPTRISHPMFLDAVEAASRRFGALIGVPFGEGFIATDPVPAIDLVSLYRRTPWEQPAPRP